MYDKLQYKLLSVINKHAPFKVLTNKEVQLNPKLVKEKKQTYKNILKIKIYSGI